MDYKVISTNRVMAISGAIASGKTYVRDMLADEIIKDGFACGAFSFSDVMKTWLAKRAISLTRANMQKFGQWLQDEKGSEGTLHWVLNRAPVDCKNTLFVMDGFRFPKQYIAFKRLFPQSALIFCDCARLEQMHRLTTRDGLTVEEAEEILNHPVEQEVMKLRDIADMVINDGLSKDELYKKVRMAAEFSKGAVR